MLEAIDKYKRLMEVIKIHGRSHDILIRSLEAAESNKKIAEDSGVPESTRRKKWKTGTVLTSLGRFKATFSNDEEE